MSAEHLGDATWERLALGELPPAERARALEHVLACAECRPTYRALVALEEGARAFDPGVPRALGRTRGWRWLVPAGAALVVAAALLLFFLGAPFRPGERTPDVLRGSRPGGIVTGGPTGHVRAPVRFEWQPVAGAEAYRVRLFAADGVLLWTSADVAAPPVAWPGTVAARPGDERYWKVEAARAGIPVAESRLVRLILDAP